jgi:transposase-like protein
MTEPNPRRPRRQFTAEFRADAVRLATNSQTRKAQLARDVGLDDTCFVSGLRPLARPNRR